MKREKAMRRAVVPSKKVKRKFHMKRSKKEGVP